MKNVLLSLLIASATLSQICAQIPDNLIAEGLPTPSEHTITSASRYLEFRSATFNAWHPTQKEMLIITRFGDVQQLHEVKFPGGARKQLTFANDPVLFASYQPTHGNYLLYSHDTNGGEYYQLYRLDPDGQTTLLTDGKSRNTCPIWSHDGKSLAYCSTRRTGADNDIYLIDPANPASDHLVAEMQGGGWNIYDFSPDGSTLLLSKSISATHSEIYTLHIASKKLTLVSPPSNNEVNWEQACYTNDPNTIIVTTDADSEFARLAKLNLSTGKLEFLSKDLNWDVESFDLSQDQKKIAFIANVHGAGTLFVYDLQSKTQTEIKNIPAGVVSGLKWHHNHTDLAFSLTHANSPTDSYSINTSTHELTQWTESETSGLNPKSFQRPELVTIPSFDQTPVNCWVYRPDANKFPGKRPVIISVHGGPEAQSRPIFLGKANYYLNELGIALVVPNVRGSAGYGKTYLSLDNGFKREDSVKDLGAVIDWAKTQESFNPSRIAVTGGSYGGYMTLAALTHYSDKLKCGLDSVGISNFVTFLKNTHDYRRDLRRVEYGDERQPDMLKFLETISPTNNVQKIKIPLFVVQGKNDPRVPVTEAEQMVKALRDQGGTCWYLMATDEGHGFRKKRNSDFLFYATIEFWKKYLLDQP